ncbi:protein LEKR1 isoform X2 [Girardinichthys multiradiatus]|uniref:protein LEKR1 isoform X2 n=1 Tax=Girardinichthys multiradiatus TaxID=208333 RepID=UPI001FAD201F|nr:protein LEKR1 isoform X2 [Girardinichthys multiradiatus]
MGDKKGSREAKHAEEEQMKTLLHSSPVYPLPEEIKKMEHSETVCRYCGVSYLVFHEFHKLRTQLAQLEAELQELKETAQREKVQHEALKLTRLEWESELQLQIQKQVDVREKITREELEKRNQDMTKALKEEFEAEYERMRKEMEEDYQKIIGERERQLRRDLEDLALVELRKQREELVKITEERETVLSTDLQKAKENSEDLRKNLDQLKTRLATAADMRDEAVEKLGKEKQHVETLRGACVRQQQILRRTLTLLRFCGCGFADVQGFLRQLTGAWQAFRSQVLQHCTEVFSALCEKLRHSTVELQKMREEKEHLTQELILTVELEEKNEKWLLCQQRCDAMEQQMLSWEQRKEQLNQKWRAAGEEVMQTRKVLEKIQQEKRELIKERGILIGSHDRAMTSMKYNHSEELASKLASALEEQRSQSALHLQGQLKELRREADLELKKERENSQMLLSQCQQDNSQLHLKLEERRLEVQYLREELQQEKRCREDERTQETERKRRKEEIHRQESQELSQAKAELTLMAEKNAALKKEVVLLQKMVWKECEEREELTAALSQAQQELFGRQSIVSPQGSSRPPLDPLERRAPPGNKLFYPQGKARVPLTRSPISPASLQPFPNCTEKGGGLYTGVGGAEERLEFKKGGGVLGEAKKREGTLPRLKPSSTANEVKRKVRLMMGRNALINNLDEEVLKD